MSNFKLNLNKEAIQEVLKDFYEVCKIKIAIFDDKYNKLITYPEKDCEFCKLMKSNPKTQVLCKKSDTISFETAKSKKELVIYHCHAGLVEASSPLIQDGVVIGYAMFGQISDEQNKEKFVNHIKEILTHYDIEMSNLTKATKIKFRSVSQIKATAKLLETCTYYVLLKDYIRLEKEEFIKNLDNFIESNYSKNITIPDLIDTFNISKTKLYSLFSEYSNEGIASYIRTKKINKAKELLAHTDLKVIDISKQVGFVDYNYFCRSFKKIVGIPAKKYRKQNSIFS